MILQTVKNLIWNDEDLIMELQGEVCKLIDETDIVLMVIIDQTSGEARIGIAKPEIKILPLEVQFEIMKLRLIEKQLCAVFWDMITKEYIVLPLI